MINNVLNTINVLRLALNKISMLMNDCHKELAFSWYKVFHLFAPILDILKNRLNKQFVVILHLIISSDKYSIELESESTQVGIILLNDQIECWCNLFFNLIKRIQIMLDILKSQCSSLKQDVNVVRTRIGFVLGSFSNE